LPAWWHRAVSMETTDIVVLSLLAVVLAPFVIYYTTKSDCRAQLQDCGKMCKLWGELCCSCCCCCKKKPTAVGVDGVDGDGKKKRKYHKWRKKGQDDPLANEIDKLQKNKAGGKIVNGRFVPTGMYDVKSEILKEKRGKGDEVTAITPTG
jgi:hypothetical protein